MREIDISAIILSYNRKTELEKCIKFLLKQNYPKHKYEIIVVDNSSDGSDEMVKLKFGKYENVKLFHVDPKKENLGIKGRNIGAEKSNGKMIIPLDDDSFLTDPNTFIKIVKGFKNLSKKIWGVGALRWKVISPGSCKIKFPNRPCITNLVNLCGGAIRRDVWRKVGGVDESFFIFVDELDLSIRIIDSKHKIIFTSNITSIHALTPSFFRTSYKSFYFDSRNYILTAFKNYPTPLLIIYVPMQSFLYLSKAITTLDFPGVHACIRGFLDSFCMILNKCVKRKKISKRTMQYLLRCFDYELNRGSFWRTRKFLLRSIA